MRLGDVINLTIIEMKNMKLVEMWRGNKAAKADADKAVAAGVDAFVAAFRDTLGIGPIDIRAGKTILGTTVIDASHDTGFNQAQISRMKVVLSPETLRFLRRRHQEENK